MKVNRKLIVRLQDRFIISDVATHARITWSSLSYTEYVGGYLWHIIQG